MTKEAERLYWAQVNRRQTRPAMPIGGWVRDVAAAAQASAAARAELHNVVAAVVDEEFHRHCRVSGQRGAALVIEVDVPARVSAMRLRWSSTLQEACRRWGGKPRLDRVLFEFAHE